MSRLSKLQRWIKLAKTAKPEDKVTFASFMLIVVYLLWIAQSGLQCPYLPTGTLRTNGASENDKQPIQTTESRTAHFLITTRNGGFMYTFLAYFAKGLVASTIVIVILSLLVR